MLRFGGFILTPVAVAAAKACLVDACVGVLKVSLGSSGSGSGALLTRLSPRALIAANALLAWASAASQLAEMSPSLLQREEAVAAVEVLRQLHASATPNAVSSL
jgi:hypothetical protein